MGVNGLWELLRPAGEPRSLVHVAVVDGFEANENRLRGLRIGIDASIWFFHAAYGREGENPELRTLFFRCTRLLEMPFLPLFVFDGPKRPALKRGKRISGNDHWLVNGMKELIQAFGFEWRMAPGEAEAELAYLNSIGQIDAVLSDDVDTFLFGAKMVIRNPSSTLSGNRGHVIKNADGRDDGKHSYIYKAQQLLSHPDIQLTRGGLVLIGLLNGGDYQPEGLRGCGPQIARGLARCGFGDQLLDAASKYSKDDPRDRHHLQAFLAEWRESVRLELRTNSKGCLPRKQATLAKSFPDDFPDIEVLYLYTNPVTSATDSSARRTHILPSWPRDPDLGKIAHICEVHFEWGIKEIIIKRFRTVLWDGAVLRALRRSALELDARASAPPSVLALSRKSPGGSPYVGTPIAKIRSWLLSADTQVEGLPMNGELVLKISQSRNHASTDGLLEFRLEISPTHLVPLCEAGIDGIRKEADKTFDVLPSDYEGTDDEGSSKTKRAPKPPPDPSSMHRVWCPASIVRLAHPDLVEEFEGAVAQRATRKAAKAAGAGRGRRRQKAPVAFPMASSDFEEFDLNNVSGSEDDAGPMSSRTNIAKPASPSKPRRTKKRLPAPIPLPFESDGENFNFDVSGSDDGAPPLPPRARVPAAPKGAATTTRPAARPRPKAAAKSRVDVPPAHGDTHPVAGPSRAISTPSEALPRGRTTVTSATVKSFYSVRKTGAAAKGKEKVTAATHPSSTPAAVSAAPSGASGATSTLSRTASTGSSILSRLDEALASFNNKRTFTRTTSAASIASSASVASSSARAFPMTFEAEEPDTDLTPPPPPPTQDGLAESSDYAPLSHFEPPVDLYLDRTPSPVFGTPKGHHFDDVAVANDLDPTPSRRTRTLSMSDSDIEAERGTSRKSPRKSTAQASPERHITTSLHTSSTGRPQRATAPVAAPTRFNKHRPRTLDDSIIEISSGSGSGSSDEDLPTPAALLTTLNSNASHNVKGRVPPAEVIDLT